MLGATIHALCRVMLGFKDKPRFRVATLGLMLGCQEKKKLSWSYKTKAIEQISFSESQQPPVWSQNALCRIEPASFIALFTIPGV
jgi:hypothetical protein